MTDERLPDKERKAYAPCLGVGYAPGPILSKALGGAHVNTAPFPFKHVMWIDPAGEEEP